MPRIYHLITTLETGGAEVFLYRLVRELLKQGVECRVGSLVRSAPVGDWLQDLGVRVDYLDMTPSRPNPLVVLKLLRILRSWRPDVLQTWMYHADLLGLSARLVGQKNIIWNVRCTDMDLNAYSRMTALTVRTCAKLSGIPRCILTNAHAAREFHVALGYKDTDFLVIPNGYNTEELKPDPEARAAVRAELGLDDSHVAAGLAARWDPMKGHLLFAKAAGIALKQAPSLRFVLYGADVDQNNTELVAALQENGVYEACRLLGRRDDVARVHAAMDIGVSSSLFGEGFSNAIAESMACGVPCVGTEVGDTARIIAGTGHAAPPNDPESLAKGMAELALQSAPERQALGRKARERIVEHYELSDIVGQYAELYARLADNPK